MNESRKRSDPDTTFQRLVARHQAIERQLEAALGRGGLARETLARAARARGADPRRLAEVRARIEAEPAAVPELSFEELSRPSFEEICRGREHRLLRV